MSQISRLIHRIRIVCLSALLLLVASTFYASTNVDPVNKYSWGANVGWMNWAGDVVNGANLVRWSSGFIYSANTGWINLGDGTPDNGVAYSNTTATDFGLTLDYVSNPNFILLTGMVWGQNVGWISFDVAAQTGQANRPRIDRTTGTLLGYAWSANLGWLSLNSSPTASVVFPERTAARSWNEYQ